MNDSGHNRKESKPVKRLATQIGFICFEYREHAQMSKDKEDSSVVLDGGHGSGATHCG